MPDSVTGAQGVRMHADTAQDPARCQGQGAGPCWSPPGALSGMLTTHSYATLLVDL